MESNIGISRRLRTPSKRGELGVQAFVRKIRQIRCQGQAGFTLIEVLIALVVAAVALAALSRALGMTASNQGNLAQKVAATWVAQDVLLQKQLFPSSEIPKKLSQSGRQWQIELESTPSLMPNYQQVRVVVKADDEDSVAASLASIIRSQ